jgi:hypothetical protein
MHWWIPKRRRRYAGAVKVEMLPLHSQKVVLELSPLDRTVRLRISKQLVTVSRWRRPPASSRSELVMLPEELASVTRREMICLGHSSCHTTRVDKL